ncbi:MAG: type II toxin-antitoxin system RelE/ParE family toxin [Bacteroidetes bacterium]|nr:type II toxin-antitoxin system RelE/ParE family toxin [Bacteroidota bacterium]
MVEWSIPAKQDLKQIHDYIARDSVFYAEKVVEEIVEKSEILNDYPEIGRIVPELGDKNIRQLLIYSYRLIYENMHSEIIILAVISSKQDFPSYKFTKS